MAAGRTGTPGGHKGLNRGLALAVAGVCFWNVIWLGEL